MRLRELVRDANGNPNWFGQVFFGRMAGFNAKLSGAIAEIHPNWKRGIYTGDNLFTLGKNLSFRSAWLQSLNVATARARPRAGQRRRSRTP